MKTPQENACVRQADNRTNPFCLRIKALVAEEAPNKRSGFVLGDIYADEAVARMAETSAIKVIVQRKERRPAKAEQKRDDLVVLNAFAADLYPDLLDGYTPCLEKLPLACRKVFV